jgi:hypothetical protein
LYFFCIFVFFIVNAEYKKGRIVGRGEREGGRREGGREERGGREGGGMEGGGRGMKVGVVAKSGNKLWEKTHTQATIT